jgi:tetrahydromethanopterin S-methyltransferase subunit C
MAILGAVIGAIIGAIIGTLKENFLSLEFPDNK